MCNTKDGTSVLMRVSTPYNTEGELQLRTLPGERPVRYNLPKAPTIQHLKLEADFRDNKPNPLTHCSMHFATRALGYKLKDGKVDERPSWFTPEVLRAARVFIKEVSSGQYTNEGHTKVEKPGFVYHPSVITNFPEESNKGRFVHLISVSLQLAQVTWISTRHLPFYVRGLLRAIPTGLLPEVFTIATLTDPDIEVMVDHHLMLWARVKNWDDYRPIFDGKFLGISYEEALQENLATIVVSQLELAEAFLDQKDEGMPIAQVEDFDDMEDETGAIRASEAPSIKNKPPPRKPGQRTQSDSPGRPNSTRAAYLMPAYRYPIAVEGAHHPARAQDYSVIINVRRAIQYGAAFSPAVDLENDERGQYVTSGIPANAIVQIRTHYGQCVNHNSLGTGTWDYLTGRPTLPNDPTIRITGRSEMPSLEIYHEDLSRQELKVWNHPITEAQQFSEGHMDEYLSDRGLTKGLLPTNLSYAEFVGMRVKTLSLFSLKNEQKEYDLFLPGRTPEVLQESDTGRGSDSNEEAIPVKGKGKGKKGKGKGKGRGKGRGKFNPQLVHPDNLDPLKLVWTPLPREAPAKGSGRTNYRALKPRTLHDWLRTSECKRVLAEGGDVSTVQIDLSDYALPEHTTMDRKTKETPKRQREQTEEPEKKRIRKGGPSAIPPSWRNHPSEDLVMSFASPEVPDGHIIVVLPSLSQLPAFGRYSIPVATAVREERVYDNPMGHDHLWSPPTNSFWDPCRNKKKVIQCGSAASHTECALCPGAKAFELVPCCWCTNWIHLRCSYAVPAGRACASHFDVVNPLDKQVVSSMGDDTIPEQWKGRSVCPNIASPRIVEPTGKEDDKNLPKHVMYGIVFFFL